MCDPISIGIGIGAATGAIGAAATGGDVLQGALIGGAMGGVTGGMGGFSGGGTLASVGQSLGATPGIFINSFGLNTAALVGFGATSLAGSVAMGMMAPKTPDYSGYTPVSQYAQQYNSQQIETTGSGGRQAAASLAEAIQRSRQRKLSQEDVGDLSIDTSAFASTGLQLA
jgi:hypothetical protein